MRKTITNILVVILLILSILVTINTISYEKLNGYKYFTNQSNFLILITAITYILKKEKTKFFKIISFITLISILMTGIIYHALLAGDFEYGSNLPWMYKTGIQNTLTHTVNPVLYTLFYFVNSKEKISYNNFYIALIHPLIYFSFYMFFGKLINFYPYPFMDVSKQGLKDVLIISLLIIAPLIILLTLINILINNKIVEIGDKYETR